jgi:glycosyltransferase involved in cell wall biosynthesis
VAALPKISRAHLVLVARDEDPGLPGLLRQAERNGVSPRVHVVGYVSADQVVPYIASATIGLIPLLHRPNHELSLITKYFEYLYAGLPILCSDVQEMARTTRSLGVGEVYIAGDADDLATAARRILADLPRYRAAYRGRAGTFVAACGWDRQAAALDALYAELTGERPSAVTAGTLRLTPRP